VRIGSPVFFILNWILLKTTDYTDFTALNNTSSGTEGRRKPRESVKSALIKMTTDYTAREKKTV
jgi:hypothetical protein